MRDGFSFAWGRRASQSADADAADCHAVTGMGLFRRNGTTPTRSIGGDVCGGQR